MKIEIKGLKDVSRDKKEVILHSILEASDMGFINWQLRERNIPGRTNIYKSFQSYWYWNRNSPERAGTVVFGMTAEQKAARTQGVKTILDNSELDQWINAYLGDTTLERVVHHLQKGMGNQIEIVINMKPAAAEKQEPEKEEEETISVAQMLE